MSTLEHNKSAANRVTWVGLWTDLGLGVGKVGVGLASGSHALVADGLHSFSDLASDVLVLAVNRVAHEAPDKDHPYGHGKFETLGTVILGVMLIAVAGGLAWDSLQTLWINAPHEVTGSTAIVMAILSIASKEWLYHYTVKVGRAIRSDMLIANAWHHRSDALSSVIVLIALIGALFGWTWLDAAGAVVVALMVAWVGGSLIWDSIQELLETSLPEEDLARLRAAVADLPEVRGIHDLRARHVGPRIVLDIHLLVDPRISVSEGHQIGLTVAKHLRAAMPEISDVTFHVDAEDDHDLNVIDAPELPLRHDIEPILEALYQELALPDGAISATLHYLEKRVHLELKVRAGVTLSPEDVEAIRQHLAAFRWFGSVRVWHQAPTATT